MSPPNYPRWTMSTGTGLWVQHVSDLDDLGPEQRLLERRRDRRESPHHHNEIVARPSRRSDRSSAPPDRPAPSARQGTKAGPVVWTRLPPRMRRISAAFRARLRAASQRRFRPAVIYARSRAHLK